jgi:hypothetical protein
VRDEADPVAFADFRHLRQVARQFLHFALDVPEEPFGRCRRSTIE